VRAHTSDLGSLPATKARRPRAGKGARQSVAGRSPWGQYSLRVPECAATWFRGGRGGSGTSGSTSTARGDRLSFACSFACCNCGACTLGRRGRSSRGSLFSPSLVPTGAGRHKKYGHAVRSAREYSIGAPRKAIGNRGGLLVLLELPRKLPPRANRFSHLRPLLRRRSL